MEKEIKWRSFMRELNDPKKSLGEKKSQVKSNPLLEKTKRKSCRISNGSKPSLRQLSRKREVGLINVQYKS